MSPLTIARVGLGLAATLKALELWPLLGRLAADPEIIAMPLLSSPRPSAAAVTWISALWAGLGLTMVAGKGVPIVGPVLAIVVAYVLTLDQQTYSNHLYLMAIVALLLGLAHTDRHREAASTLIRSQLVIVYGFAAVSKINTDFLSGRAIAENLHPALASLGLGPRAAWLATAAILAEGFVACGLLHPRLRLAGAVVGVGLHIAFTLAVSQTVAMVAFTMLCLSLYPLYFPAAPAPTPAHQLP